MPSFLITLPERRKRPTVRDIARGVATLQRAESIALHANRDTCFPCLVRSTLMRMHGVDAVPSYLLKDKEWVHRHVLMPGARRLARVEDEWAKEHGDA